MYVLLWRSSRSNKKGESEMSLIWSSDKRHENDKQDEDEDENEEEDDGSGLNGRISMCK